jgi:hypothetical protein
MGKPPKTKKRGAKRPPKRAPPKGEVLVTTKSKTLIELPGPTPFEMRPGFGVSKKSRMHYLRARAGIYFMMDQTMPTVEDICAHSEFDEVSLTQMRNWAAADRWQEKRREFWEGVNAKVRKKLGNKLIERQMRILDDCDKIYQQNLDFLTGGDGRDVPQPKSYESLVRAHVHLIKAQSDMTRDMIDVIVPPVTPETSNADEMPRIVPEFTAEEARVAALAVVQQRRQLQSQNNPSEDNDDGETVD